MEECIKEKERLDYMDIAKGFGIICVIIGHMENSAINRFVFSFHMPLFFLISGYFLSERRSPKEELIKRIKQLLPPYIFTCICIMALSIEKGLFGILIGHKNVCDLLLDLGRWLYASLYGAGTNHDTPFQIIQIGAIWFLLALILGTYIVQKVRKTRTPLIWIIFVALIGYFSSKIFWLPWSIQAAMTATVFIYFGVLLRRYNAFEGNYQKVIFTSALVFWINEIIHGNPSLSIVRNCYPNGAFDFIGGECGAICVIFIVKYVYEHMKYRWIWSVWI